MKYLITLILLMVMAFQTHSQTISTITPRVTTIINSKGDTLIQMNLADAKIVLTALLDKQIVDSLLTVYTAKDEVSNNIITLQKYDIKKLEEKSANQDILASNLNKIISNNGIEIKDLNDIIKQQKKEIRKQKILKIIGFSAAVVLPVSTILYMSK